jgi:hypothetical protein
MKNMRLLRRVVMSAALIGGPTAFAQENPDRAGVGGALPVSQILDTEKAEFATFHLAPIIVPEGEKVGDLIDASTTSLIARAEDCFSGLSPRNDPSLLPSISTLSEKGVAAALGIGGDLVSGGGEVSEGQSFVLEFKDVQVQKVSLVQLRKSFRKDIPECQQVRPFIDATYTPSLDAIKKRHPKIAEISKTIADRQGTIIADSPPPLLLGTVFTARRAIRIETSRILDAKAKLSLGQRFLEKLGLGDSFTISGSGNDESSNRLVLEGKEAVPVAFAPAFVVKQTRQLANGHTTYEVAAIDSDQIQTYIALAKSEQDMSLRLAELVHTRELLAQIKNISNKEPNSTPDKVIVLNKDKWKFELANKTETQATFTTMSKPELYKETLGLTVTEKQI